MPACFIRFYEELNDFLPLKNQRVRFTALFREGASVREVIETLAVLPCEVDLILVNGQSVDFSYMLRNQDDISVYPVFESFDIGPVTRLRPRPLRRTKFVLDVHLGKLARYLRLLGLDSCYKNDFTDRQILGIMSRERRTILTRDRKLLKMKAVTHGYFIRSENPKEQMVEVIQRFHLQNSIRPFTLCLQCNQPVEEISKNKILSRLQPRTRQFYDVFFHCPSCERLYWRGSHVRHMEHFLKEIGNAAGFCN
ncbi:MAG: Mut7-C RNAse domain-containing protein [Nitrospinales bacterium]